MCVLNSKGNRRMLAVFDEVQDFQMSDRIFFFAGFYGRVMSLVLTGSVPGDGFVAGTEDWLEEVKGMIGKRPK